MDINIRKESEDSRYSEVQSLLSLSSQNAIFET